ncbi:MAG TPA: hypothetical protein VNR87_14410, partial [Flavisolibacter sp.]|nr:hypothetical protein [Flavisolibacter sp.]
KVKPAIVLRSRSVSRSAVFMSVFLTRSAYSRAAMGYRADWLKILSSDDDGSVQLFNGTVGEMAGI